ncbi:MAG: 3D domain-containing protein [Desulfitobacterium hafniense]|nr:3D domain-containing protein [Desulfitobacterium hafniense]
MYSLPVFTYTDYWRASKSQGIYIGGTLVLLASTSAITSGDDIAVGKSPVQTIKPLNTGTVVAYPTNQPVLSKIEMVTQYKIEDIELSYQTEYKESDQIPPGMSRIQERGSNGTQRRVIKVSKYGEKVEEDVLYQFELNSPKKRVVIQNTKVISGEQFDLSKLDVKQIMTVEATAYTYTGNPTATGVYPREGLIAVDPRVIPLGSRVYVEGYGYAIAADTGGAIKGNKVDVFFPSLSRCLEWGRRSVKLFLLKSTSSNQDSRQVTTN